MAFGGAPQATWGRGLPQMLSKGSEEFLQVICSEAVRSALHGLPGKNRSGSHWEPLSPNPLAGQAELGGLVAQAGAQ